MKKILPFALLVFGLVSFIIPPKPKKVIFFGDSITAGAVKPGGFIVMMQDMLKEKNIENNYELIGAGIGGNKIYDLYLRMDSDVVFKKPDVVVIYIGVNDVWHKATSGTGTDANKFEIFYTAIIKKLQSNGTQVILCTPAAIGEKKDNMNQQDGDLNAYSQIIRDLAKKYNCSLVDLRKTFMDYQINHNPENKEKDILTRDRVHLNETGNKMVADMLFPLITK